MVTWATLILRVLNGKTDRPIFRLKHAGHKLQRLLSVCRREFENVYKWNRNDEVDHENLGGVVKGHFPVVTICDGDEPKKFQVSLSYLISNPAFLELLKEMESKFGNDQNGVLVVPCKASKVQRIIPLKQVEGVFDWNLRLP